jgi:hypothetical protein
MWHINVVHASAACFFWGIWLCQMPHGSQPNSKLLKQVGVWDRISGLINGECISTLHYFLKSLQSFPSNFCTALKMDTNMPPTPLETNFIFSYVNQHITEYQDNELDIERFVNDVVRDYGSNFDTQPPINVRIYSQSYGSVTHL